MAIALDRARIEEILRDVADRVEGDWVLVGGALVAVWLDARRTTEDVDMVSIRGSAEDRTALFDAAEALGLPLETLNSAADWFLRRIDGWDVGLRELVAGKRARILRPSPTVLVLSKLSRLSESDLEDCRAAIAWAGSVGQPLDTERVLTALAALRPVEGALADRRSSLRAALEQRS